MSFANKIRYIKFWRRQLKGLPSETTFYYEPHNWAGTRSNLDKERSWLDTQLARWRLKKPCVYIKGLNINWDGRIYICGNDPQDSAIIGKVPPLEWEKIYSGAKRMDFLRRHEEGDFEGTDCDKCTVNTIFPLLFIKKRLINLLANLAGKL